MSRARAFLALVLSTGLVAPLPALHVHYAQNADHHPLVHAHFGVHHDASPPASSLNGHDSDAAYVDHRVPVPRSSGVCVRPAGVPVRVTDPSVDARVTGMVPDDRAVSVHDPPLSPSGLRAPPAFLADLV